MQSLDDKILARIRGRGRGYVFFSADFASLGESKSVLKALERLVNKGFSDNTTESLLKQSETLQMKQRFLERCLTPCTDALIAHVFGTDSEEWEHRREIRMTFSKPIISTEKDLAEVGARFAASVSSFVNAGVSADTAIELSSQFFPTVKVTDEMLAKAKESYEKVMEHEEKMGSMKSQMGSPQGNVKGKATTTGSFTKAK